MLPPSSCRATVRAPRPPPQSRPVSRWRSMKAGNYLEISTAVAAVSTPVSTRSSTELRRAASSLVRGRRSTGRSRRWSAARDVSAVRSAVARGAAYTGSSPRTAFCADTLSWSVQLCLLSCYAIKYVTIDLLFKLNILISDLLEDEWFVIVRMYEVTGCYRPYVR